MKHFPTYQHLNIGSFFQSLQGAIVMHGQMESPRRQKSETLRLLGLAFKEAGQYQEAREVLAQSIAEQELIPGAEKTEEDSVMTLSTSNELASVKKLLTVDN